MNISHAAIKGYRSLQDVELPFTSLTSCIGPNGSGKSSLLGALRLFFDQSAQVDDHDFWSGGDETADEISITTTFSALDDEEQTFFRAFIDADDQLVVERRFERGGSDEYLANRLAVRQFQTIRRLERAHTKEFNELVASGDFAGLERASNKDEVFALMDAWEAANQNKCEGLEVDFDLIERLFEAVSFLSVEAFEDPADHVEAHGRGAVAQLLAKVVDHRTVQAGLDEIAESAKDRSEQLLRDTSSGFSDFASSIRDQVERFVPGFNLKLDWAPASIQGAKPRLQLSIETEDGLNRPLEYQGHGVQRALMYAALTAQVEAGAETSEDRIVLVIEEPEAFQHPLSCRVLSGTLRELSQRNYQVIYSTHSPFFIHPELIDGLRIFRRTDPAGAGAATFVESLDEQRLLVEWQRVFEVEAATTTSVLAHLQRHLPPHVLEGLFARHCVLVEGAEDEAVIRAAANIHGLDLDAGGVAVIQTNGKQGMPNVATFLSLAGVDVYPLFDLDRQQEEANQKRDAERQILRALAIEGEPQPGVHNRYACCEHDMTRLLREELEDVYDDLLADAAENSGYSVDRGRKVPAVVSDFLNQAAESGYESETVRSLGQQLERLLS